MKKKILAALLAVVLAAGLLPGTARAEDDLPDWYFLFAIIKSVDADCDSGNGVPVHTEYTMTQYEIDVARDKIEAFETYMNGLGVMRAHVDVVELDGPVTELAPSNYNGSNLGSYLSSEQAAPLLKAGGIDLDGYDHVTCVASLNVDTTGYLGITGPEFDNGSGQSFINLRNQQYVQRNLASYDSLNIAYVHEVLHFMERMCGKWGVEFDVHKICEKFYDGYYVEDSYTDMILNRIKGDAETGTGVFPAAWQYPPRVLRSADSLTAPDGAAAIGDYAFYGWPYLKQMTIPSGVSSIGYAAFYECTSLTDVTIAPGVVSIGAWAFGDCFALTKVTLPSSVTTIGQYAFQNCASLTEAVLSSGVSSIGTWTFGNCAALTKVTLPSSVTSIGYAAFWNTGITDVYYGGTQAQWNAINFGQFNSALTDATIHYNSAGPGSEAPGESTTPAVSFTDVPDWCAVEAGWAVREGITNGTNESGTTFSPGRTCTDAEILTFLYRAAGEPPAAPSSLNVAGWCQAAVDWAYSEGMIGTGFDPDTPCTRSSTVLYIWQAFGSDTSNASDSSFIDVPSNADYADAVSWAVANGITSGTNESGTTFSPTRTCMRGEIVTLLYRAYA